MLHLRIHATPSTSDAVLGLLVDDPAVSAVARLSGASVKPAGDVITADVAREAADDVVHRLVALGVPREGSIQIDPVRTWVSQSAFEAEQRSPGSSADAVVWPDVVQRAYEESELNWTYLSFMSLATLLASIAIILDSQILVIGAMILGPEFGAIAALGVALVRRRRNLFGYALRTLALGFAAAIAVATLAAEVGRVIGWITVTDIVGPRPGTAFIYTPDKWSLLIALLAGAAGVLSLTSAKAGGLAGVFVSVTTVPAAGNVALGLAFGVWHEVWGSTAQLFVNISAMALAGWMTLALQHVVWSRVALRRVGGGREQPTR